MVLCYKFYLYNFKDAGTLFEKIFSLRLKRIYLGAFRQYIILIVWQVSLNYKHNLIIFSSIKIVRESDKINYAMIYVKK